MAQQLAIAGQLMGLMLNLFPISALAEKLKVRDFPIPYCLKRKLLLIFDRFSCLIYN